ncbi:MAG: GTP cyclohydrolase II [Proteobacteria bacterium]|nr:GTP cyclohydrolase II [Pseudomonadota bacterium]MDA1057871.1 GTP cyclohydrolase II [Pseudomonadota bacterium]
MRAIADLRRGTPVVVRDGANALAILATEFAEDGLKPLSELGLDPRHLAITAQRAAVLNIAPTGQTSVVLAISPHIDSATLRSLADPTSDLDHPLRGPFRVAPQDLSVASAALILCKRARLLPAVVFAALPENVDPSVWAAAHDLLLADAAAIDDFEVETARTLTPVSGAQVPLADSETTRIVAFRPADAGIEHVAIIVGRPHADAPTLVRLHSECFTGDLLASLRCDCGQQLRGAIQLMQDAGAGVLLYLAQEGRGIGLINKLRAYALQDQGFDTMEANRRLGFEDDERVFQPAAEMLRHLGFTKIRLLTNNPAKVTGLTRLGIDVTERVAHAFPPNNHNQRYLETKAQHGHQL